MTPNPHIFEGRAYSIVVNSNLTFYCYIVASHLSSARCRVFFLGFSLSWRWSNYCLIASYIVAGRASTPDGLKRIPRGAKLTGDSMLPI